MQIKGTALEIYNGVKEFTDKHKNKNQFTCEISVKDTKKLRTLAQNRTFYKLFTDIGNYIGNSPEDTKDNLLKGIFGTHKVKCGIFESDEANEKQTSTLNTEQGIEFITKVLSFVEKYNMPITITKRELLSLYNN